MGDKKRVSILGSTGSIGISALDVIERHGNRFEVEALTAWGNSDALKRQILRHRPKVACIVDEEKAATLKEDPALKGTEILWGVGGLIEAATCRTSDLVVAAIVGAAGLIPTFAAIEAGKDIALANKETLVAAGNIVMKEVEKRGINLLPVDSEHSAIYQCLAGHRRSDIKRLVLTASGGPFRKKGQGELRRVKAKEALNHPTWSMGSKITIDSATLMNKGLEVIEARWLFNVAAEKIDVLIHPQSIVHSMVEYIDGSVIAQMGTPDMRGPIAYALSYPERLSAGARPLDLAKTGGLTFEEPDTGRFPALETCYEALKQGGTAPAVLSAANETAVDAFLSDKIGFTDIPAIIKQALTKHEAFEPSSIEEVLRADRWGREEAKRAIQGLTKPASTVESVVL